MKFNRPTIIFTVILLLLSVCFKVFVKSNIPRRPKATDTISNPSRDSHHEDHSTGAHQTAIDPEAPLIYTHHARCRMDCRHITETDIRELLREGSINEAKSQQNETPCPTYAIEDDRNSDGVRLRVVFARCDRETKVVTCIDRDHEYACDCK